MDSNSQFFGDVEECNSSESGWTMYVGSPNLNGELEYHGDFDELEDNNYKKTINRDDDEDGDTDDSMASDASSGPSHFSRNGKSGGIAMVNFKNTRGKKGKEKDCSFTNNKAKNSMKNGYKNHEDKLKESIKGINGASNGGGNKVRKSIWMGKGK